MNDNPEKTNPKCPPWLKTYYAPKPIPIRCFDWCAYDDAYEPGKPIGYGATENEAIWDYWRWRYEILDEIRE
jgi:hypothetical protein